MSSESPANEPQFQTVLGRGHRAKNTTRLTESITAELEGSQDVPAAKSKPRRSKKSKTTQNRFNGLTVEGDLDDEGSDYASPSGSQSDTTSDSGHESDVIEITNEELAHLLPSKTVPERTNRRNKRKRIAKKSTTQALVTATATADAQENSAEDIAPLRSSAPTVKAAKRNPIYHFYDVVQLNAAGQVGDAGDKHYKCHLGNRKVLTMVHRQYYVR